MPPSSISLNVADGTGGSPTGSLVLFRNGISRVTQEATLPIALAYT